MDIFAEGPEQADIMIVGEAWGKDEEKARAPFKGVAGKCLDGILDEVGIARGACRVTNVVHARPKGNNFKAYYTKSGTKTVPSEYLRACYGRLQEEIVRARPNVIVACGREALKALTGRDESILKLRGSIIETAVGKVIPVIHPAALLRNWKYRPATVCDFIRILEESACANMPEVDYELVINPSYEEVLHEIEVAKKSEYVAYDIETECHQITCIGISSSPKRAMCIPFWFGASGSFFSKEQEHAIWRGLDELLARRQVGGPVRVAHNGMYDAEFIRWTTGINAAVDFDTMLGFHTLYAELPKSLGYVSSIYTKVPYYKDKLGTSDMDEYWRYNATDAVVTGKCYLEISHELDESNLRGFYEDRVHALIEPILAMQARGVRFDIEARNRLRRQYRYDISKLEHALEQAVGKPLNVSSYKQMSDWLYKDLKAKKIYTKREEGKVSLATDEEALNEIYDQQGVEAIRTVLAIREKRKLLSTYLEAKLDDDKRIRCSYNISGTETGRLSSSATSRSTGTNLQNIPSGIVKRLFLADEGKLLVNADLSQAEARIVAYLANEERLIRVFEEGGDIHRRNAANIFRCSEEQVTPQQRQLAKRVVHATNYGMGPGTFAKQIGITVTEARQLLNTYFSTYPRIELWQEKIRRTVRETRRLTNPLGRKRTFFDKWNSNLAKEGFAFLPQSTVADIVNEALIEAHNRGLEVLLQVHDSIVIQCKESNLQANIQALRACLTRPIDIDGKILTIPVDIQVGSNWGSMQVIE